MRSMPGIFIVLEGSDGSGKTTQFNLLAERLKAIGYDIAVFDFPRYDKESSHFVREYLNGGYGDAMEVSPYTASLFYALDRYEAAKDIKKALDEGKIVLSNRYVGSNMAHQGSKFSDEVEQRGFFVWADNLEYQLLGIPRPKINIFLRVPAAVSYELIKRKAARSYTDQVHDEHEKDIEHLKRTVATYDLLCQLFPKDFRAIECTKDGDILSIPEINNRIWSAIKPLLPAEKPHPSHSVVVSLAPTFTAEEGVIGPADKLNQKFKNASLLLRLQVQNYQRRPIGASMPKWSESGYSFYTPRGMTKELEKNYKETLERIGSRHRKMHEKLSQHQERSLLSSNGAGPSVDSLLMPVTPLAALGSFDIILAGPEVKDLAANLLSSDLEEVQWAAKQLYVAARQKWPDNFKQSLESNASPEVISSIIAKLADNKISANSSASEEVKLLESMPRQEFDLLAESIYPFSNLSLEEIVEEVAGWSYQQKYESLKLAADKPDLLTDKVRYKMDIISDHQTITEVLQAAELSNLQVQPPTARYGYEVPSTVEAAGADDLYLECFDESLKLFSRLQGTARDDLAAYATLLGHKVRWQMTINARNLRLALNHRDSEPYQKLAESIKESVTEAHPLLWEILGTIRPPEKTAAKRSRNRVKPSKRRGSSSKNR